MVALKGEDNWNTSVVEFIHSTRDGWILTVMTALIESESCAANAKIKTEDVMGYQDRRSE